MLACHRVPRCGAPAEAGHNAAASPPDPDDPMPRTVPAAAAPAPRMRMAAEKMGATPGGAQDISYARERITAGEIPHPSTFTPEGLLSEHDLPLDTGRKCSQTLCLTAAAVPVELTALPEARQLGQLPRNRTALTHSVLTGG